MSQNLAIYSNSSQATIDVSQNLTHCNVTHGSETVYTDQSTATVHKQQLNWIVQTRHENVFNLYYHYLQTDKTDDRDRIVYLQTSDLTGKNQMKTPGILTDLTKQG